MTAPTASPRDTVLYKFDACCGRDVASVALRRVLAGGWIARTEGTSFAVLSPSMATVPPRRPVLNERGRANYFVPGSEDCGDCAPPELEWPVADADIEHCEIIFLDGFTAPAEPLRVEGAEEDDGTRPADTSDSLEAPLDLLESLFSDEMVADETLSFDDLNSLEPDSPHRVVLRAEALFHAELDPVEQTPVPDLSGFCRAPLPPPRLFESRGPWLALLGGVCCAVLAYLDFQIAPPRGQPRVESLLSSRVLPLHPAVGLPSSPASRRIVRTLATPVAPVLEPDEVIDRSAGDRQVELAARAIARRASLMSARAEPTTTSPHAVRPAPAAVPEAAPARTPSIALRPDPPDPVAERESSRAAESLTALVTAAADSPARVVPEPASPSGVREEDRIRSTLASFQTAYAQLNAKAARAVWPTVDERALARAFDGLKSQHLAFDRCEMTVKDAEASAACSGRSTYVPRVGAQSPRTYSAEWKFHLKKVDEEWRIDSASFR